jgi:hypothetical protein
MIHPRHRAALLAGLVIMVLAITAAAQGGKFTGGYFKANDGTTDIGLDFDTTGALNVYVDGQAFSKSTWEAKSDTVSFGPVTGPEGYNCTGGARYLWAMTENRLTFSRVSDDCEVRLQALTGLTWTKG